MKISELLEARFRFDHDKYFGVAVKTTGHVEITSPGRNSEAEAVEGAKKRYPKAERYRGVQGKELNKLKTFDQLAEGFTGPEIKNPRFDAKTKLITLEIGVHKYEYAVNAGLNPEKIWNSFMGVLKHSTGNALKFLKKSSNGRRLEAQ